MGRPWQAGPAAQTLWAPSHWPQNVHRGYLVLLLLCTMCCHTGIPAGDGTLESRASSSSECHCAKLCYCRQNSHRGATRDNEQVKCSIGQPMPGCGAEGNHVVTLP